MSAETLLAQACPRCGSRRLRPVSAEPASNLLCTTCGACWQRGRHLLHRVHPLECPALDCAFRPVCVAGLAERSP